MKTITLKQAQKRIEILEQVETYRPITLIKKLVGYSMIGIGIITIPLPTGSIFLIMGGCLLLAIDYKKLLKTIKFYAKETAYWVLRVGRRSRWVIKYFQ